MEASILVRIHELFFFWFEINNLFPLQGCIFIYTGMTNRISSKKKVESSYLIPIFRVNKLYWK